MAQGVNFVSLEFTMPTTDPVVLARNRLGGAVTAKDAEKIDYYRRALTYAKAERAIREAVAAAPPLSHAQKRDLAALLTGGAK